MSCHTQYLIGLLGHTFREWTLYKPAMTRPCNSERYFIGKGFRGMSPGLSAHLNEVQRKSALDLYPTMVYEQLGTFLEEHMQTTTEQQIHSINRAIHLSENPDEWWKEWLAKCLHNSNTWCETFRVPSIPRRAYELIMSQRFPHLALSQISHTTSFLR